MAQSGDEITYTFSGAKETEDISGIDELVLYKVEGAAGGSRYFYDTFGGLVEKATADVSNASTLEVWVGETPDGSAGGFGRSNGGAGGEDAGATAKSYGGGGSTEVVADGSLIVAVDGGGGSPAQSSNGGGGGGGRGGVGGSGRYTGDEPGDDAEGVGFGGDGWDGGQNSVTSDNLGGQELGTATLLENGKTESGAASGSGEIVIGFDKPQAPTSLSTSEDLTATDPTVDLSWTLPATDRTNNIYRAAGSSPSFPADFSLIDSVAAETTSYQDTPPSFEQTFTYRVTSAVNGGESDASPASTITTSSEGELVVTITNTNSPVTTGDTLDLDVEIENIGDYRADENIDAVLEPQ